MQETDFQESQEDSADTTAEEQDKYGHLRKYRWPKGVSGNPNGRPKGSLSPKDRIRQMFESNPEQFDDFLDEYIKDPQNKKHVVEMLDGKPSQSTDINLKLPQFIVDLIKDGTSDQGTN